MPDRQPPTPQIITMGCRGTHPGESWDWHTHRFDEICMIAEDSCTVGHGGQLLRIKANTILLVKRGERHGFWNSQSEAPDLWVLHFAVSDAFYLDLPALSAANPLDRVWKPTQHQTAEFKSLFTKISLEAGRGSREAGVLCSAWLQALLACLERWKAPVSVDSFLLQDLDADLLELWKTINDLAPQPFSSMEKLSELVDGYDSLRHRFRKVFGQSPRTLMQTIRMQRAQQLLMDGQKSVKEIASAVGYVRQHEFARAFRKAFGVSPTEWRVRPRFHLDLTRSHGLDASSFEASDSPRPE